MQNYSNMSSLAVVFLSLFTCVDGYEEYLSFPTILPLVKIYAFLLFALIYLSKDDFRCRMLLRAVAVRRL